MTKTVALTVFAVALAAFASSVSMGGIPVAYGQPPPEPPPANVTVANGPNPGEVVLMWTEVPGATTYRVGWLAVEDFQAYPNVWGEKFAYSDVTTGSNYTIGRLTPGIDYYLIVGRKSGNDIAWSSWASLTLNEGPPRCPALGNTGPPPPAAGDGDFRATVHGVAGASSQEKSHAPTPNRNHAAKSREDDGGNVRLSSEGPPANVTAVNGANPGEVVLSWTAVPGATSYRVGWLAVADYQAYPDIWREKFAYSDVTATYTYTVARLTPSMDYYLIVGRKDGNDVAWSSWATLTLNEDEPDCPVVGTMGPPPPGGPDETRAAGKMYWSDAGSAKIQRANLDGSGIEDLVTSRSGLRYPESVTLHWPTGKMYWVDWGAGKIQRANLDGSDVEDLVTTGLTIPDTMALDITGGKMYWTDDGTDKIQRANLDGSHVEDVVTSGLIRPDGLALDTSAGKMYWADRGTRKIQRANLDGSDVEDVIVSGLSKPDSVALDPSAGKIYWTDHGTDKIQRANLDGSGVEDLVTSGLVIPDAITLDLSAGKIYWTDWEANKIQRSNLDGSGVEDLVTSGLNNPSGIAIAPATAVTLASVPLHRWILGRAAERTPSGSVVLTPASRDQTGYLVHPGLIGTERLTADFSFEIGGGTGADGLGLAIVPNSSGARGMAITFDTYQNPWDASSNHVELNLLGTTRPYTPFSADGWYENARHSWAAAGSSTTQLAVADPVQSLRNNNVFDAQVELNRGVVDVYLSNLSAGMQRTLVLSHTIEDFVPYEAYVGFIAYTGDLTDRHIIHDVSLRSERYQPIISAVPRLYWVDEAANKVQRTNREDYRIVEDLVVSGLDDPGSIALDLAAGKMYWTDDGTGKIQRADLDGGGVEDLLDAGDGLVDPVGIALDVSAGRMYWIDRTPGKIYRADLDGSDMEELVSGLDGPYQVALDLGVGRMYWTERFQNRIWRAHLDGSNRQSLAPSGLADPMGIALDVAAGKMYWTERHVPNDLIRRADLDGSNAQGLVTTDESSLSGLALDAAAEKMYWTDEVSRKIRRANLDGTLVEDVITSGLSAPEGIAIAVAAPASTTRVSDRDVLLALYNATDGPNWRNQTGWNSQVPIGQWHGVTTDDQGQVIDLDLGYNGLTGTLPAALGELDYLESLNLRNNELTGSIPAQLGDLTGLIQLNLSGSQLSGEVPTTLGGLVNLTHLNLSGNRLGFPPGSGHPTGHTFSGEIPTALAELNNLRILDLSENHFTGQVPVAFGGFGNLVNLTHLNLSGNQLTGSIPFQLSNRRSLLHLDLSANRLSGEIPYQLGDLARLEALDLSNNNLNSAIPLELVVKLDSLQRLNVSHNRLSGRLSSRLGELEYLSVLDVSNNQMTGEIPAELGKLPLTVLYLQHNNFTGCLPFSQARARSIGLTPGERGVPVTCETASQSAVDVAALEREVLEYLYDEMIGDDWRGKPTWRTDAPIAEWEGVFTNEEGRVIGLDLGDSGLAGYIPFELTFLPELAWLRIHGNPIKGCIPRGLKDPLLVGSVLAGEDNAVSHGLSLSLPGIGFLPSIIENAASTVASTALDLGGYGTVGEVLSTTVTALQIADAALQYNVGGLSKPLCALPLRPLETGYDSDREALLAIRSYYLGQGVSPAQFSNWTGTNIGQWRGVETRTVNGQERVTRLGLDGRGLKGGIPPAVAGLGELYYLNLSRNELTGPIPPQLGHLSNLRTLALNDNRLTSATRQEVRKRVQENANGEVEVVDVTETYEEPIPPELANLLRLEKLYLQNNRLTGMMPQDLDLLTYTSLRVMDVDREGRYQLSGCLRPNRKFVAAEVIPQVADVAIDLLTGGLKAGAKTAANLTVKAVGTVGRTIGEEAAKTIGENAAGFAAAEAAGYLTSNHDLGVVGEVVDAIFGPSERVGELIGRMAEFLGFYGLGGEFDMGKVYCKGS